TIPADVTIECTEDTSPTNTGTATATDDCAAPNVSFTDNEAANCGNTKTITRTWTATDACGNSVSADQVITVVDTTDPTFTVPADITIECDVNPNDLSITGDVTDEADNCSTGLEATYDDNVADGSCTNESIITRIWTLTDECGNDIEEIQIITVVDTTDPTFTVPADITIECDVNPDDLSITGDVTDEADNCSTGLEATYSDNVADGSCANASIITRTWTLVDECNNMTSLFQTITVVDTTDPTFTVPADITIECDVNPDDLSITGDVIDEADNCSTGLEATYTDNVADGSCANASIITRTWTLVDECNNMTSLFQTITVVDTTDPTFTVPADITIECDVNPDDLSITGDVTDEADNCSTGLEATYDDNVANGSCANESIITRIWTLTDECGNDIEQTQIITVVDTTDPTFTVPADITIECDVNPDDLSITGDVTDEADNCSTGLEATYTDNVANGSCANASIITRTWTLVDECNNMTSLFQTITVVDTTDPTFTVPADITIECDVNPDDLSITGDVTDEADNCSTGLEATYEDLISDNVCIGNYLIQRTWILTDECGNEIEQTQIITVQDTTAPTLVTPIEDITIVCGDVPEVPSLIIEDACSNDITVLFDEESTQVNDFEDYEVTRTWIVTDDCGNEAIFSQTIFVEFQNVISTSDGSLCILDDELDLFDLLSGDFDGDGTWSVVSGDTTLDGNFFNPSNVEVGVYTFRYAITQGACPTEVEVNVTVDDDCVVLACGQDNVDIPKTVTANGDTINDVFDIEGIDDCGFVIELQIFNRWGAKIYENNNYQNDWGGEAHGSSIGASGMVPTGTYYYIINLRNSGLPPFTGPLYVATDK
uniref:gliding motility-associated C-terminal domain-containing protein n=1 Tax=Winogradskyella sp. TaxID=1883156 RepID=UPI002621CFEF